ncbi:MAG: thiamine phosphate synthase [Methanomassiliicoccaceae archaeon]|nr:thiamine phosphate synthase [Methanomassiliicoccaceae archaeon]
MKVFDPTLYLVTDRGGMSEKEFLDTVKKACDGGITMIQLREKEMDGMEYLRLALKVREIADGYRIPLIIDDRIDIALASGAAGVHLGQTDIPVCVARGLMGCDKIIGASAKTKEQALRAEDEGADYLGVGAIFPTSTKVITRITEVSALNEIASAVKIPVVAIGGLNSANIDVLYRSRADGIAVVSAIMRSADPRGTAQALKEQVLNNFASKAGGR